MQYHIADRQHYPALDGLRGLAILLVLACHQFDFLPWLHMTYIGVDLFFVLSGFLITGILLHSKGKKNNLKQFYLRRGLRVFPLYYLAIILFFLLSPLASKLPEQYDYYANGGVLTWGHLQNWLYVFWEKPNDYLVMGHFWSLSVEEQFYFVWPFIILFTKNQRQLVLVISGLLCLAVLSRLGSWILWGDGYRNYQFQYMTRIDGLCIGSLVAVYNFADKKNLQKKVLRVVKIILALHSVLFITDYFFYSPISHFQIMGYTSISALFALLLVACLKPGGTTQKIFQSKPLMQIGRISFGLYIFHVPVLIIGKLYFLPIALSAGLSVLWACVLNAVVTTLLSLGISILSYRYFESFFLHLKDPLCDNGIRYTLRITMARFQLTLITTGKKVSHLFLAIFGKTRGLAKEPPIV